jgi:hypothetical protein
VLEVDEIDVVDVLDVLVPGVVDNILELDVLDVLEVPDADVLIAAGTVLVDRTTLQRLRLATCVTPVRDASVDTSPIRNRLARFRSVSHSNAVADVDDATDTPTANTSVTLENTSAPPRLSNWALFEASIRTQIRQRQAHKTCMHARYLLVIRL